MTLPALDLGGSLLEWVRFAPVLLHACHEKGFLQRFQAASGEPAVAQEPGYLSLPAMPKSFRPWVGVRGCLQGGNSATLPSTAATTSLRTFPDLPTRHAAMSGVSPET